jgi:hypothetical protein
LAASLPASNITLPLIPRQRLPAGLGVPGPDGCPQITMRCWPVSMVSGRAMKLRVGPVLGNVLAAGSVKYTSEHTWPSVRLTSRSAHSGTNFMEYKGVEYTVVQMAGDAGWKWEVRFGDGKNKSGVAPERALAIKLAEFEIDRVVKDRK